MLGLVDSQTCVLSIYLILNLDETTRKLYDQRFKILNPYTAGQGESSMCSLFWLLDN